MFRWNHIAAAIFSSAMVFSMMSLGVTAAEQTNAEMNASQELLEVGMTEAAEYYGAGEWTVSSDAADIEAKIYTVFEETDLETDAADGVTGTGSDETAADDVTGTDPDETAASDAVSPDPASDPVSGEGADSGATNSEAVPAESAKDTDGANGGTSAAAAEYAADEGSGVARSTADTEITSLVSIHGIVGREFVQYCEIDSVALAGQYFGHAFRGADAESGVTAAAGDKLKGVDKVIYDALREAVEQIAAGVRDTGVVVIPISTKEIGLRSKYTAEDLGLDYVYSGSLNPDLADALEKAAPVHYDEIMDCLLADCEYEMFPLTGGVEKPAGYALPYYASGSGDDLDVYFDDHLEIALKPADEFADPDAGKYAFDVTRIKIVRGAAGTAKRIAHSASHIVNKTAGMVPTTK